jgi:hypothetical protein
MAQQSYQAECAKPLACVSGNNRSTNYKNESRAMDHRLQANSFANPRSVSIGLWKRERVTARKRIVNFRSVTVPIHERSKSGGLLDLFRGTVIAAEGTNVRVTTRRASFPDVAAGHRRSALGVFLPDGPRDDTSRIRDEPASVFEFRAECRTGRLSRSSVLAVPITGH